MDLFRCLTDAELDQQIKALALQITSGASQISSPDAGSASYMTRSEAIRTLRALERTRARRRGEPADAGDRLKRTQVVIQNDYWQR